jgi:hypothetical protein
MEQVEPSSYRSSQYGGEIPGWCPAYSFCSSVKGPNGFVAIESVPESVRKGASFGNRRSDSRLQEVHETLT